MINLLSLNLDKEIYFCINNILNRYNKQDLTECEMDLIQELLGYDMESRLSDIENSIESINYEISEIRSTAENAQWQADENETEVIKVNNKIDKIDTEVIKNTTEETKIKIDKLINSIQLSYEIDVDTLSSKYYSTLERINDILTPLSEIIDFLESKKTLNIRKPKQVPKSTILNLRTKLKELKQR